MCRIILSLFVGQLYDSCSCHGTRYPYTPTSIMELWVGGRLRRDFRLKAVFTSLNEAFVPISRSRFKQCQIPPLRTFTSVLRFCINFCVIFGRFVNEILFSKDRLNSGKYKMLKIWWILKIEIWSEELIDRHQTVPYKPGILFRGVNCLVVSPTHFNLKNSLLKLL